MWTLYRPCVVSLPLSCPSLLLYPVCWTCHASPEPLHVLSSLHCSNLGSYLGLILLVFLYSDQYHGSGEALSHHTSKRPLAFPHFPKVLSTIKLFSWPSFSKHKLGFASGSDAKEFPCNVRELGLISEPGKSLGEGNGNPFQYSCLEKSMDRGVWQATVEGVTKSRTWLSD